MSGQRKENGFSKDREGDAGGGRSGVLRGKVVRATWRDVGGAQVTPAVFVRCEEGDAEEEGEVNKVPSLRIDIDIVVGELTEEERSVVKEREEQEGRKGVRDEKVTEGETKGGRSRERIRAGREQSMGG